MSTEKLMDDALKAALETNIRLQERVSLYETTLRLARDEMVWALNNVQVYAMQEKDATLHADRFRDVIRLIESLPRSAV